MKKTVKFPVGASTLAGMKGKTVTEQKSLRFAFRELYPDHELADKANGFESAGDIKSAKFFIDGKYVSSFTAFQNEQDVKMELTGKKGVRMVNVSGGMAFTLPVKEVETDYTIPKLRVRYAFDDSVLAASIQSNNPYDADESSPFHRENPWFIYGYEWLIRFINDDRFIANCGLTRLNGTKSYKFTEEHTYGDLTIKEGYDVYRYDVLINDETGNVERPYYNIAILREVHDASTFALFVLKSKSDKKEIIDAIVQSYTRIAPKGVQKNYFDAGDSKPNPKWSKETKEYFNSLCKSDYVNWGAFSWSMPGPEEALHAGNHDYDTCLETSKWSQEGIEKIWGHKYDIYPTYTHLSSMGKEHHFPLDMANELAGGNGKNGKPVLQFSYQYTTDNNTVATMFSPLFDIMRGKYDEQFRRMARDLKKYAKPVFFRLNNEMNTDWTSYCGMLTLLDPDIFNITWQRLYDIFEEEGVDNTMWIWNPVETTSPYCSWGEDLAYFPGLEYAQLLGGTNYEFNNYDEKEAAQKYKSFRTCYKAQYDKNKESFSKWFNIISETACGSGGATSGKVGRNAAVQAKYVKEMFEDLNAAEKEDWAKQIKGIVWFNCNDIVEENGERIISNRLSFYLPEKITFNLFTLKSPFRYDDLAETWKEFEKGFAKSKQNEIE